MPIPIPRERDNAWKEYKKKFGKDFPSYYIYKIYGYNWQGEIEFIKKCIAENKPAEEKKLDDDIVYF